MTWIVFACKAGRLQAKPAGCSGEPQHVGQDTSNIGSAVARLKGGSGKAGPCAGDPTLYTTNVRLIRVNSRFISAFRRAYAAGEEGHVMGLACHVEPQADCEPAR